MFFRRLVSKRTALITGSVRAASGIVAVPTAFPTRAWYITTATVAATAVTLMAKPIAFKSRPRAEEGLSPAHISDTTAAVMDQFKIPLVPSSIQEMVVGQAVQIVANELPKRLTKDQMSRVTQAMDGMSEGIGTEERKAIVSSIANSLDAVPLVPKSSRESLVAVIVDVLLGDVSISAHVGGSAAAIMGTASTLMSEDGRKRLATKLNEKINLPGLSEEQEQVIFEKAVGLLGGALESLVPSSWRSALQGASADEITAFKAHIVEVLEGKVPIPMISEDQKKAIFGGVVDCAFEMFLDTTGLDGVMLSPELQLERITKVEADTKFELESCRRQAKRKEKGIQRRMVLVGEQKKELQREIGHSHMVHFMEYGLAGTVAIGGATLLGWFLYSRNSK